MRLRRLQQLDEVDGWYDDAYAYENDEGRVVFRYNLTWERVGARYNKKFAEAGISLEKVETALPLDGQTMRWLPIEVIEEDQVEAFLEELDAACDIPKPRPISMAEQVAA
jgi:hypothetical protein